MTKLKRKVTIPIGRSPHAKVPRGQRTAPFILPCAAEALPFPNSAPEVKGHPKMGEYAVFDAPFPFVEDQPPPAKPPSLGHVIVIAPEGATLRLGFEIDASQTLARLPSGARAKAFKRELLKPPDASCVAVWRVEVEFEGKRGWVSESGRVKGKAFPILRWEEAAVER